MCLGKVYKNGVIPLFTCFRYFVKEEGRKGPWGNLAKIRHIRASEHNKYIVKDKSHMLVSLIKKNPGQ